MSAKTRELQ